jgi:hypothetical protein
VADAARGAIITTTTTTKATRAKRKRFIVTKLIIIFIKGFIDIFVANKKCDRLEDCEVIFQSSTITKLVQHTIVENCNKRYIHLLIIYSYSRVIPKISIKFAR